jgi:UDP-glucose 4-epimerase
MIEWMLRAYNSAYGLDYVVFRYFNACGADSQGRHGQKPGATHIIARVLESIRDNTHFTLNGTEFPTDDGTCIRDYVHVEDIADAHIMACQSGIPFGVYNLGTNSGHSNREIITMAEQVTGRRVNLGYCVARPGDPAVLTADANKFINMSSWKPQFNLEEIITHAWSWYNRI